MLRKTLELHLKDALHNLPRVLESHDMMMYLFFIRRALQDQIGIFRYHLKRVDIGSGNGDMGYYLTDKGYWDIEMSEIGILAYQISPFLQFDVGY